MAVATADTTESKSAQDPLLPWLLSIKKALADWRSGNLFDADLCKLLSNCFSIFKNNAQYRNDIRFLKICLIRMECAEDYERVYREVEENNICIRHAARYQWYANFLEAKEKWLEAHMVYQIGISRDAEPLETLKLANSLFIERMSKSLDATLRKIDGGNAEPRKDYVNPWSSSTKEDLLKKIDPQISNYDGYHLSRKAYTGKVALSSLKNSSKNKIIEIGKIKYHVKGCAGQGAFAQVYKACIESNPDDIVALKIQMPPFPWEFYMYRQLDQRISVKHRSSFGFAEKIHLYLDCSILVCQYLCHGTLQDAINSYVVTGKTMEEVLCMYYTIEMLHMLETLHAVGIIHGDFKPDNLLIRYAKGGLTEDESLDLSALWPDQGLCLVDWGRGIDLHLFSHRTEFKGDSQTSGFRCVEMQQNKPWKFQVDTYGLCVTVHMMLHGTYMEIEKKASSDGGYLYMPKSTFKRYWNVSLWKNLFEKLLNAANNKNDRELLRGLKESFLNYLKGDPQLIKKLKELLAKQRASLCSA